MHAVLRSALLYLLCSALAGAAERPNILIMMSDDQSFPHASVYGSKMVITPNFDRIARDGVLFNNAFCASPGCSPSRAAFLTGRQIWQIEHAGTHASSFGRNYRTFVDLLADAGYATGYTGKGWGPGNFKAGGRSQNPAGPNFNAKGGDYAAGFKAFLEQRPEGRPFCFWFGSHDPHRGYEKGSGLRSGKTLAQAEVPGFLPDTPEIRGDLLDYAFEVERFDRDCGKMLELLEAAGELDNTLIIVTSDNGMPFPYAKANCNEFGIHLPLAIAWKLGIPGGRTIEDLVSFIDLTATIHELTGIEAPQDYPLGGRSLLGSLRSTKSGQIDATRDAVFAARERHSSSRFNTLGYPQRCIRTPTHLLIHNLKPERWPAGPARKLTGKPGSPPGPPDGGFHDIDGCPSLSFLIEHQHDPEIGRFFHLATDRRPEFELYDIVEDPACLNDLSGQPGPLADLRGKLEAKLAAQLTATGDPRVTADGDVFETYPRYSGIRWFPEPDWAKENPESIPQQPWLEAIRNRSE